MPSFARLLAACLIALLAAAAAASAQDAPFTVEDLQVSTEREVPEVCFTFSQPLGRDRGVSFEDFVTLEPAAEPAVTARDRALCLAGLEFGSRYRVVLRAGLPSAVGTALPSSLGYDVYVPDRPASLSFRESGTVLPRGLAQGIPLASVNVSRAEISLYRINDRNLVDQLQRGSIGHTLSAWEVEQLESVDGEKLWSGSIDLEAPRNRTVTTVVPVQEVLGDPAPGIYVAVAGNPAAETPRWESQATQWFVLTDLALTSYRSDSGLWVQARSLDGAQPLGGVTVSLLAHNNSELGRAGSDAEGWARFPAGLVRGTGGNRPHSLFATTADGDFVYLDLTDQGLELLDRGVAGRALPGPLDAFLYTDRGIYRPGETVHAAGLLRDEQARAVPALPLTFVLWRPDGRELLRRSVTDQAAGYALELPIPSTAPSGPWALTAHLAADEPAIGRAELMVADFVPPQLEVTLDGAGAAVDASEAGDARLEVTLAARWLYGAPAASLAGESALQLQVAETPFPDYAGFSFGLVQEELPAQLTDPTPFATDEAGRADLVLALEQRPDTSRPLEARVIASVFDLGGRAVQQTLTVPVHHQELAIGLRPRFAGDAVPEGASAVFEAIAVGPAGARVAGPGLEYTLFAEDYDYVWYQSGSRWYAESVIRDRRVSGGALDIPLDRPAEIQVALDWGRYRLEVFDPMSGVASSRRFTAGWWADPTAAERPDEVELSLDRERYRAGETARVFVKPPFAAEVQIVIADREVRHTTAAQLPAEGGFVEIPVAADWTAGTYLLASAFSKSRQERAYLPRRAIGVAWLPLDRDDDRLALALDHPETARPLEQIEVSLAAGGFAADEEVHVTLAAVDDGVLQITGFEAPDPEAYYLGQRLLGLGVNDLYGRLIDPRADALGVLRSGGDQQLKRQLGDLPERSSQVVALFSGIRKAGPDGRAEIAFALPDFNGRLRLMAVAWTAGRVGHAESTLVVRSPVIAELALPRFLAPSDEAEILVSLRNLDGPDGTYRVTLATEGPLAASVDSWLVGRLAGGAELRRRVRLSASGVGVGTLRLAVSGPDGLDIARSRKLSLRPAQPVTTSRLAAALPPGRDLVVGAEAFTGLIPGSVEATVSLSPLPQLDLPGLLAALDRYPYGCVEQISSRALPLIYANELEALIGRDTDLALATRIQQAVYRLAAYQAPSGGFGLWGPSSPTELWLSAYALDVVVRAAEAGYEVPPATRESGLAWLRSRLYDVGDNEDYLAGVAYARYVLARAGQGDLSEARYLYETRWRDLPSDLARAQTAAALAWYGDRGRAGEGFRRLGDAAFADRRARDDYGTPLRDLAASVALMAETRLFDGAAMAPLVRRLTDAARALEHPSTQELAWLALAAHQLSADAAPMRLSLDGRELPERSTPFYARVPAEPGAAPLRIGNRSGQAINQILTVAGVPEAPLPAERNGFVLKRGFFAFDGTPLDLDSIHQSDAFVMTLEGESQSAIDQRALVVHLLPAGWEIEDLRLGQGVDLDAFPWLGKLSKTEVLEYRDDRFLAAFDLTPRTRSFKTAMVIRAVTPGSYLLPGGQVEDMYRPDLFARQAPGRITVLPREG